MRLTFLLPVLLMIFPALVSAQVSKDSLIAGYMKEVKEHIKQEDFKAADKSLKKVFAIKTVLPDEVAFYYGYIQVKLKNYNKGKEGLQKYIQLTEGVGPFYAESVALMDEANSNICKKCNNTGIAEVADTCTVCHGVGKSEEPCTQCKDKGQEICSSCRGKGVVVYRNSLGTSYTECSVCKGKGVVSCQFCGGTKMKKTFCSNCKGTGVLKKKVPCDHLH